MPFVLQAVYRIGYAKCLLYGRQRASFGCWPVVLSGCRESVRKLYWTKYACVVQRGDDRHPGR